MSDPNDKTASILLKRQGKTEAIFLYDFTQFLRQNEDAGLYRAKINGCWHCPDGKYTALSADAVAALVRDWLTGAPPPGPRPQGLDKPVRVFAHWDDDNGGGCGQAWTKTPPHLGADGRWWIWIDGPRLVRCEDVRVLTRQEIRKLREDDLSEIRQAICIMLADAHEKDTGK